MDIQSQDSVSLEPLRRLQQQRGAVFATNDDATPAPLHFGDPAAEYKAAGEQAALIDLTGRARIALTGADRASFLHNFCTNDIKALSPGAGCEAFVTSVKGRLLGHIFVAATEDSLWIDSVAGADDFLLSHLDKYLITEDVELHNRTGEYESLLLCGPCTADSLLAVLDADVGGLPMGHNAATVLDERPVMVTRVPFTCQPTFMLTVEAELLGRLWDALSFHDARPSGSDVLDPLRIEAGMPVYGQDISDEHIAQEVGRTAQTISFTKGCYLGQEPIARLDALGHVNRELRGVRFESSVAVVVGCPVFDHTGEKEVGRISSVAACPGQEASVALTTLRRECTGPGTAVRLKPTPGESVPGEVFWIEN